MKNILFANLWYEIVLRTARDGCAFVRMLLADWRTGYGVFDRRRSGYERLMALHHVGVACVVAMAILIVEHAGALNWLENLTLRVASGMQTQSLVAEPEDPNDAVVLAISTKLYETAFNQASPLDRQKLKQLIENLAARKPKMLVLDLDVSPEASGQDDFDKFLINLSQQGTQLVLATPFPVHSDALIHAKYVWMKKLCSEVNIRFADSRLPVTQGINLRYFKDRNALGDVAYAADSNLTHPVERWPCVQICRGESFAGFLAASMQHAELDARISGQYPDQVHLDPATLRRTLAKKTDIGDDLSVPVTLELAGKTVFLGGDYSGADRFQTIARQTPVPGVIIHAAAYNGMRHDLERISHSLAIALDIVIGTLAGMLFHYTWARYNGAQHRLDTAGAFAMSDFSRYVVARLWLVINFSLLIGFVVALLYLAARLLDCHLWSNPAPMVLGIFIKSLLGSRSHLLPEDQAPHHGHGHHAAHHHAPAWLVGSDLALVAITLALLNYSLGHH